MKHFSNLLRRFRQGLSPKQGKKGSSLGLVMIIGAVLVIWVIAIMPMMVATGNAAYGVQASQEDYLDSKSAIEFCKSELEHIVQSEIPYTFAVINGDGTNGAATGEYVAVPNKVDGLTNSTYQSHIVDNTTDDTKDVPQSNSLGNQVAAICAVTTDDGSVYDIKITTYNDGVEGISYSATYTLTGSLLIYPEAYAQSQALPLSDFVLVDGKLASKIVWKSTIADETDADFTETLLPWTIDVDQDPTYASSGEYPAVFKMTAQAAGVTNVGDEIKEGSLSDTKQWIMPTDYVDGADRTVGTVWYQSGKVYLCLGEGNLNITNDCTIYYNGSTTAPSTTGQYAITVDYKGTNYDSATGTNTYVEGGTNALPGKNVYVGTLTVAAGGTQSCNCKGSISLNSVSGNSFVLNVGTAVYGYSYVDGNGNTVSQWGVSGTGSTISGLSTSTTYYFYCYHPAGFGSDGKYYTASGVNYLGMVSPITAVSELEDGEEYLILQRENSNLYAMTSDAGTTQGTLAVSEYLMSGSYAGSMTGGVRLLLKDDEDTLQDNMIWTTQEIVRQSGYGSNKKYTYTYKFSQGTTNKTYLQMTGSEWNKNWTLALNTAGENQATEFTVSIDSSREATVSGKISSGRDSTTGYLKISELVASTTTSSSKVYFVKAPDTATGVSIDNPNLPSNYNDSVSVTQGTATLLTDVKSQLPNVSASTEIYANRTKIYNGLTLSAGTYTLTGSVTVYDKEHYFTIGTLTVAEKTLSNLAFTKIEQADENDELQVTVTASGWDTTNGGVGYFGYVKVADTNNAEEIAALTAADFNWVSVTPTASEISNIFRLEYGTYVFAVAESGTANYKTVGPVCADAYTMVVTPIDMTNVNKSSFEYTLDSSDGTITWYKLPKGIMPSKLTVVYGIAPVGTTTITWDETYTYDTPGVNKYGVYIQGTKYTDGNVFEIQSPMPITIANGCMTSLMRGSSLYFMGQSASIDTKGVDVHLYTDLLILNYPITGGGSVYVQPYSTGEDDPGDTLVFFVNDMDNFKAYNFYKVPAYTDLTNVNSEKANAMMVKGTNGSGTSVTDASGNVNITFPDNVKAYFRNRIYPDINLDIAYATPEQLSRIVSGETIGWTSGGVLKNSDTSTSNSAYVVCAYVTQCNGGSYLANRILIAAKAASDGTNTLYVPSTLKLTTRYLSLEADNIVQQNNSSFMLYNLGQNESYISKYFSLGSYSSKTLQVDYERYTIIQANGTERRFNPQICRYDDAKDLFEVEPQDLMVTYTTDELKTLIDGGTWVGAVKTSTLVDRYVTVKCTDGTGELNVNAWLSSQLSVYANYIYIDGSVDTIKFSSLGSGSIVVNTQESGYTAEEYLGLFRSNSAESYNGTLLYMQEPVKIVQVVEVFGYEIEKSSVTIPQGFYYLKATENGTSLVNLSSRDQVTTAQLENLSVYVDPDTGKFSSAYVDTGIYSNEGTGLGGFSGGVVG